MPLCPQITNTPITVSLTADYTVTNVIPVLPANTEQLNAVIVLADGKTKAFYQATAPTVGVSEGDIWFDTDDGNKQYYYNGTAWVSVQDTAIAAATSAAAAATAASAAAAAAAVAAQTTADGKNKVYRQGTSPGSTGNAVGDIWFNTSSDNAISRWDGTSWVATSLGNGALASISASKITAGTIDASVITVSNINAGNISTGTLAADRILAASITGAKIAANTITAANITAGTITATEIATGTITASKIATGTITATQIAAGTITTDKLVAGTLTGFTVQTSSGSTAVSLVGADNSVTFKTSGTNVGHIVPLSSFGVLTHYGATADPSGGTFPQMFVGSSNVSLFANTSNGIGIATSTGISLIGATNASDTLSVGTFSSSSVSTTSGVYMSSTGPVIARRDNLIPFFAHRFNTSGTSEMIRLNYNGADSGGITTTAGGVPAFRNASDYRLKQNIQSFDSAASLIKQIQLRSFEFIKDPTEPQVGFIAHELAEVLPALVMGEKDAIDEDGNPAYQSILATNLIPYLTGALKEAIIRIEALEGE